MGGVSSINSIKLCGVSLTFFNKGEKNQFEFYPMAVNMELVGYRAALLPLGVLEREGLLQTSRTMAERREEVMLLDLVLNCLLFSSSLEY